MRIIPMGIALFIALAFSASPTSAVAQEAGPGAGYLDHLTNKVFRVADGSKVKITLTEQGEWKFGTATTTFVPRDPAGGFKFWFRSPLGIRADAEGRVGARAVAGSRGWPKWCCSPPRWH
ncbi:hypothetical protein [Sphingomonas soli]|uniref:hypothetical protein n=1 Tax=Sphingomonas soli TaxID=266127 RepID=UPI00082E4B7F|nr:hypothetical protein [Sphingomonas soli]